MPLYRLHNTRTGEDFETFMTISERERFLADNPHITQPPALPGFCDPARVGVTKPPTEFRELLKHVKKQHKGSTINDR